MLWLSREVANAVIPYITHVHIWWPLDQLHLESVEEEAQESMVSCNVTAKAKSIQRMAQRQRTQKKKSECGVVGTPVEITHETKTETHRSRAQNKEI